MYWKQRPVIRQKWQSCDAWFPIGTLINKRNKHDCNTCNNNNKKSSNKTNFNELIAKLIAYWMNNMTKIELSWIEFFDKPHAFECHHVMRCMWLMYCSITYNQNFSISWKQAVKLVAIIVAIAMIAAVEMIALQDFDCNSFHFDFSRSVGTACMWPTCCYFQMQDLCELANKRFESSPVNKSKQKTKFLVNNGKMVVNKDYTTWRKYKLNLVMNHNLWVTQRNHKLLLQKYFFVEIK